MLFEEMGDDLEDITDVEIRIESFSFTEITRSTRRKTGVRSARNAKSGLRARFSAARQQYKLLQLSSIARHVATVTVANMSSTMHPITNIAQALQRQDMSK